MKALIIGNDKYLKKDHQLKNAVNDTLAISNKLRELGFEVNVNTNCTNEDIEKSLIKFEESLVNTKTALFYFSGHGLQIDGTNYLTGIDTSFVDSISAKRSSMPLNEIIERMNKENIGVKILILDACRDNPLPENFRGINNSGLAPIHAPKGTIIAFSTSPGEKAKDGGMGENSIYTGALLKHLNSKYIHIEELFKRVRTTVYKLTNGTQISWEHTSLIGNFYFNKGERHFKDNVYKQSAIADKEYVSSSKKFNEVLSDFKSYTWHTQNRGIRRVNFHLINELDENDLFIYGRNILQAAIGGEFDSIAIIEDLSNWLRRENFKNKQRDVLNGILFEIYFDSSGNFRRGNLKSYFINKIFKLENFEYFEDSFIFIKETLNPFRDLLLYILGENRGDVSIDLSINRFEKEYGSPKETDLRLDSVSCEGKDLLYIREKWPYEKLVFKDLKEKISIKLGVPLIKVNFITNQNISEDSEIHIFRYSEFLINEE